MSNCVARHIKNIGVVCGPKNKAWTPDDFYLPGEIEIKKMSGDCGKCASREIVEAKIPSKYERQHR